LNWINITVKLSQLDPWAENPKSISRASAKRLLEYWDKIGQFQTVAIGPQNGNGLHPLYDGHQRLDVLKAAYGLDYAIDARMSSRPLTDDERAEMVVQAHAGTTGQWDWDKIAAWDTETLQSWGMDADLLGQWNIDVGALATMLDSEEEPSEGQTPDEARQTLAERFIVPPFSVLDARQGYWQDRKRAWLALGIQSELGRGIQEDSQNYRSDYGVYNPTMGHKKPNATPGGSLLPATTLKNGKTVRGDGRGKPIKRGGVSMAMHNDPMQRKNKYDKE
jgi:hypothetical protein